MAYTYDIKNNSEDSHQTSPAYVLTFTRMSNRDTLNYQKPNKNFAGPMPASYYNIDTRNPLVVINDAVSIKVTSKKENPQHNFSCVLKQGDLNYLTAISPGDYVIVNMVNDETKALNIRDRALEGKPINKKNDGFKGLFKVGDVRMQLMTSPNGDKVYAVSVTGRAFDEFNNVLYFNPAFDNTDTNSFIATNNFKNWTDVILQKEGNNVQILLKEAIKRTIGIGAKVVSKDLKLNQIPTYKVPKIISKLLNKEEKKEENDPFMSKINNYYLGIWNHTSTQTKGNIPLEKGFTNFFKKDEEEFSNWYKTKTRLSGTRQITLEDFSNISVWSLLKDYSNPVINEMYTCFRIADDGHVYPSFIARQIPFNTRHYLKNPNITKHTQFLDMPRWKVSPFLIKNLSIGRSDAARINFVQIFTRNLAINENLNQASQIALGNYVIDENDIKRNGRRPYVRNCNYDYPLKDGDPSPQYLGKTYANLVADWVMNGHLKLNGSISCAGIEEPICIGDNIEFDKVVYQIESITHNMVLTPEGLKSFNTDISMSMGIGEDSTKEFPVYGEMEYTDTFTKRKNDYQNEKVLPGFSDTQDISGRVKGEELKETKEKSFTNPPKK